MIAFGIAGTEFGYMLKKQRAVEVIPAKMWITYDSQGNKTGALTRSEGFNWLRADGTRDQIADPETLFRFEEKAALSTWHQKHVFGYPVLDIETFKHQEKDNLPCFTKTETSKTYFAAGYYVILFENNGWTGSFCPKISTLRGREFLGPFKTEHDRDIVLLRKKRES